MPGAPEAALFFDFDDTLHDFRAADEAALEASVALAAERARPPLAPPALAVRSRPRLVAIWERAMSGGPSEAPLWQECAAAVLAEAGVPYDAGLALAMRDAYAAAMAVALRLFPEAIAALGRAREVVGAGGAVGVMTNGPAQVQRERLAHLGLLDRLSVVAISGELGWAKPDRRFFAAALERAAVAPARAVLVGDNPEADVAGARAAGMGAVWLDRSGRGWPAERLHLAPDAVARDLTEAVELAAGLLRRAAR